jgi:transcriptional regulator with XRE-family HTH domain
MPAKKSASPRLMDHDRMAEIVRRNIRMVIEKTGQSQRQIAEALGVSPQAVSDMMNRDSYRPPLATLVNFCDVTGVTLNWVIRSDASWPPERPGVAAPAVDPSAALSDAERRVLDLAREVSVFDAEPAQLMTARARLAGVGAGAGMGEFRPAPDSSIRRRSARTE